MSSGIYWEGRCTWQRGMPAERDAARICVWLVTLMLLTNGFWDTACAACIFSGTCGWLSTIHLDILLAGGIPTDALITRVVGFWIITNGCIRLLAGACPDTGGETGAFATYVIEGIAFVLAAAGSGSIRGYWMALASFLCAAGVGLRAWVRRVARRVFPVDIDSP